MIFFWIAIATLAAAVTIAVTRPLLREADSSGVASEADAAVYKDQLAEIENDRARGVLSDAEADAARAEVARRLLRVAEPALRIESAVAVQRSVWFTAPPCLPFPSRASGFIFISVRRVCRGNPCTPGLHNRQQVPAPTILSRKSKPVCGKRLTTAKAGT